MLKITPAPSLNHKRFLAIVTAKNIRGREQSHSLNYQKLGHDLLSVDELAVLDGSKCILQLRGVRPFLSEKYDLTKHPNYFLTSDADKKNAFDIEKFLSRKLTLRADDRYTVVTPDETI